MLIISYDISEDKLRNKFAKYLAKFGGRLQYSVFEIQNSDRVLETITADIKNIFGKRFSERDSVLIFELSATCKVTRFGYARHDNSELIIVS
jgi:CRISPR-associated protein Cas2